MTSPLKKSTEELFKKSLKHLEYSFKKIKTLPDLTDDSPEEHLEAWESFASRFARSSDLFLSKLVRLYLLEKDPGYRGSVMDMIHDAEKFGLIENANTWKRIRELRNIAVHEYSTNDLLNFYAELQNLCPHILRLSQL